MSWMDQRYRWRLLKQIIIGSTGPGIDREELEKDIDNAFIKAAQGKSLLINQMRDLSDKWGEPVFLGIKWLEGDNSLAVDHLNDCLNN